MPIPSRILGESEDVLVDLRPHWLFFIGPMVWVIVALVVVVGVTLQFPGAPTWVAYLLAGLVALPGLWLAARLIRWRGVSLVVTTARFIYRRGVFGRDMAQLRLSRISEIQCRQRLWERVLGTGALIAEIPGEPSMAVGNVRRVCTVQRIIHEQLLDLAERVRPVAPQGATPDPMVRAHVSSDPTPPHGMRPLPEGEVAGRAGPGPGATNRVHDQLIQLDDLRRRGIVSPREFQAKKAELLDRL